MGVSRPECCDFGWSWKSNRCTGKLTHAARQKIPALTLNGKTASLHVFQSCPALRRESPGSTQPDFRSAVIILSTGRIKLRAQIDAAILKGGMDCRRLSCRQMESGKDLRPYQRFRQRLSIFRHRGCLKGKLSCLKPVTQRRKAQSMIIPGVLRLNPG